MPREGYPIHPFIQTLVRPFVILYGMKITRNSLTFCCTFFVCAQNQVFLFSNSKCKRYFHNHLKPAKFTWTARFRKQHKKDIHAEAAKKRWRTTKRPYSRSIVSASLDVIQKKRAEKPEVRDAAREAALRKKKKRIKKTKDEKRAKKVGVTKSRKTTGRGNAPKPGKAPKLGG
uniref:Large ribosomal subunit protein eL24-related N-terminal domain-containing protein n=1 Tax=Triticum urartu TaxID=4572 RepID=A0A8R7VBE8_TRIUA